MATTKPKIKQLKRARAPMQNHAKNIKTSRALPRYKRTAIKPARRAGKGCREHLRLSASPSQLSTPSRTRSRSSRLFSAIIPKISLSPGRHSHPPPSPRAAPNRLHNAASRPAFTGLPSSSPPPPPAARSLQNPSLSSLTARPRPR